MALKGVYAVAENGVTLERWAGPGQNFEAENVFQRHCPQLYSWPLIPLGTSLGAQGLFPFFNYTEMPTFFRLLARLKAMLSPPFSLFRESEF